MADYDAGLVADVEVGVSTGSLKAAPPSLDAGLIQDLAGEPGGGGAEIIRDIPPMTRDVP